MIKKIYDITLRDVSLLYETESAKHLLLFKWTPFFLVKNRLEKLAQEIFEKIGSKSVDDLDKEFEKIIELRKIMELEALYKVIEIEFHTKTRIHALKLSKKKITKDDNFKKAIIEIKKATGIEIKTAKDLIKFEDYIQWRGDKFREVFPEPQKMEQKEISAIQIIYSYFNYLEEPYNENMRLAAFMEIRDFANRKIEKEKQNTEN